jgi:hypothetical protein
VLPGPGGSGGFPFEACLCPFLCHDGVAGTDTDGAITITGNARSTPTDTDHRPDPLGSLVPYQYDSSPIPLAEVGGMAPCYPAFTYDKGPLADTAGPTPDPLLTPSPLQYDYSSPMKFVEPGSGVAHCYPYITYGREPLPEECDEPHVIPAPPPAGDR